MRLKLQLLLGRFRLAEVTRLAHVVLKQLSQEGFVTGFGEHALFLKNGQNTQGLKKIYA